MATSPLFIEDFPTLLGLLKLSQIEEEGSTQQIVEEAVRDVTVEFYRRLGHARIIVIQGIAIKDPPTDDNEYLALLARVTERKYIKCKLLIELPVLFANPGTEFSEYNEEAPYLEASGDQLKEQIAAIKAEIEENMELLAGEEVATTEGSITATSIEPAIAPPLPGDTAWGS